MGAGDDGELRIQHQWCGAQRLEGEMHPSSLHPAPHEGLTSRLVFAQLTGWSKGVAKGGQLPSVLWGLGLILHFHPLFLHGTLGQTYPHAGEAGDSTRNDSTQELLRRQLVEP